MFFFENDLNVHPLVLGFYLVWITISLIKQHMDEKLLLTALYPLDGID